MLRDRIAEHLPGAVLKEALPASDEALARVHSPQYIDAVAHGTLAPAAQREIGFPWSPAMAERARLLEAFAAIDADRTVRVAILTGRHGAFCTGDDLAESLSRDVPTQTAAILHFLDMCDRIAAVRVPVIAVIDGWCIGGGLELALACDIRLAGPRASFACSAVRMG
ncbi:enoyl-CoA hydratase-related protein, partial [Sphingomonas adhaesiva]|uniref:enoyl-CoA hydratase-related protein n=1 Tax=Sphingomonas adhaesiva TaxID=28212 RepID=UPI0035C783B2